MKRLSMLVFSLAFMGAPVMRATSIFTVSGVFQSGAVMSGTITLDTLSGLGTAADVFLTAPDANEFTFIQAQFAPAPGVDILQLSPVAMGVPQLILAFPVADFTGYTGGLLCSPGVCGGSSNLFTGSSADGLVSGTATQISGVPEPSPAWLIGIGVAGLAVGWRRKAAVASR